MNNNQRRSTLTFGAIAGGVLAAAFLPMAVAFADNYDLAPDITTFAPTQVEGYPPLINEVTGTEDWNIFDLSTNSVQVPDAFVGNDTETTIGSFTNDDYLTTQSLGIVHGAETIVFPVASQFDIANFGGGFENAWMDIPSGPDTGISDLLITPFGDFELFGTGFADLATVIG